MEQIRVKNLHPEVALPESLFLDEKSRFIFLPSGISPSREVLSFLTQWGFKNIYSSEPVDIEASEAGSFLEDAESLHESDANAEIMKMLTEGVNLVEDVYENLKLAEVAYTLPLRRLGEYAARLCSLFDETNQVLDFIHYRPAPYLKRWIYKALELSIHMLFVGYQQRYPSYKLQNLFYAGFFSQTGALALPEDLYGMENIAPTRLNELHSLIPLVGAKILKRYKQFPSAIVEAIAQQYERADGSGLPEHAIYLDSQLAYMLSATTSYYDKVRPLVKGVSPMSPAQAVVQLAQEKEQYDGQALRDFISAIGRYPVGSLVELTNGIEGVVVRTTFGKINEPTIFPLKIPTNVSVEREQLEAKADGLFSVVGELAEEGKYKLTPHFYDSQDASDDEE